MWGKPWDELVEAGRGADLGFFFCWRRGVKARADFNDGQRKPSGADDHTSYFIQSSGPIDYMGRHVHYYFGNAVLRNVRPPDVAVDWP